MNGTVPLESELYFENSPFFQLDDLTAIHLGKAKTRDFYCLFNKKNSHEVSNWPNKMEENNASGWRGMGKIFNSLKNICKESKLKEFQFKLIHRIVVTKKAFSIRNQNG